MSEAGGSGRAADGEKVLILVVEDDPNDEFLTLRALKQLGCAHGIRVVHDGAEAMDFLRAHARPAGAGLPRLVLLDLKLPKMSGIDVLRALRLDARLREVPVVVFTSSSQELDVAAAYESGANSFVPKPVNHERFMQTVSTLGSYWTETNLVRG
jgi:CheY-like chemotaxis protein